MSEVPPSSLRWQPVDDAELQARARGVSSEIWDITRSRVHAHAPLARGDAPSDLPL